MIFKFKKNQGILNLRTQHPDLLNLKTQHPYILNLKTQIKTS